MHYEMVKKIDGMKNKSTEFLWQNPKTEKKSIRCSYTVQLVSFLTQNFQSHSFQICRNV